MSASAAAHRVAIPEMATSNGAVHPSGPSPRSATACVVHVATIPESLGFLRGHLAHLRRSGFHVVCAAAPGERLRSFGEREGVPVAGFDFSREITPARDLRALARLWRFLKDLRPTIVHAHTPKAGLVAMLAATLAGTPVRVYHVHGFPFMTASRPRRILLKWTERIACVLAHRVYCVSPSLATVAVSGRISPRGRTRVLHRGSICGVDARDRFHPGRLQEAALDIRKEYGIPPEAPVLGYVGRLVRDKGVPELVDAYCRLSVEFLDLRLLLVGPFEEQDPVPAETRRLIETHPGILEAGWVEDPAPYYAAMDVLALPSHREGFGLAALEAAAVAKPVVATRIPGCVDAVADGETGTLVPPADAGALAKALRRYLRDPRLGKSHGEAGRARALRDFRTEDLERALSDAYRELLSSKGIQMPPHREGRPATS